MHALPPASGMPKLNNTQLNLLISDVLKSRPGGACVAAAMEAALRQKDMAHWCIPRIKNCLACGDVLDLQRTTAHPLFYPLFKQGSKGTVYRRHCARCATSYELDGYQRACDVFSKDPSISLKLPYPPHLMHLQWIRVSSNTFVDRRLVVFQLATVHMLHGSSQSTCSINTFMVLSDKQIATGGE